MDIGSIRTVRDAVDLVVARVGGASAAAAGEAHASG